MTQAKTATKNLTTEERLARIRGLLDGLAGTVRYDIPDQLREEILSIAREVGIAEGIRCRLCGREPTLETVIRDGEKVYDVLYTDSADPEHGLLCIDCDAKYDA